MQLFDGKTLNGWAATGNPDGWIVDHGCIFATAEQGKYLYYTQKTSSKTLNSRSSSNIPLKPTAAYSSAGPIWTTPCKPALKSKYWTRMAMTPQPSNAAAQSMIYKPPRTTPANPRANGIT